MKINILTQFPEMFGAVTTDSILGRANENKILEINLINIRNFTEDKHNRTDDTPFGGGVGMTMFPQPAFDAIRKSGIGEDSRMIYMSPRGRILDEKLIRELSSEKEITILCGHYEGVDQRILDNFNMEEISIGDYVLTGGELPAMVLIDAVSRFIPGVLGEMESATDESIYSGLLEADQYTKPREYEGLTVPDILTSGNHKEIHKWQLKNAIEKTFKNRPDLFKKWLRKAEGKIENHPDFKDLTKREKQELAEFVKNLK